MTYAEKFTNAQRQIAYKQGQKAHGGQVAKQQAQVRKNRSTEGADTSKGKVHFDGDRTKLNKIQRASLDAMEVLAKALGIQIYVESFEGTKNANKNGWYDPKDGSIHININAGADGKGTMLFTVAHELTHFIRQWSPAKFEVLANFLVKQYGEQGVPISDLIDAQIADAKADNQDLTREEALEEVVADSVESILSDGSVIEMMAELKQQDHGLWQKICDWFKDLAGKLRAVVDTYKGVQPDSTEGRMVADMKDMIGTLEALCMDALVDASENFDAGVQKITTEDSGGVKYSERDELSASEYNKLTRKKPIKVSSQEWAMIKSQRKSKYSSMEEHEIPIIDFFRIGDYVIPNNGFVYYIRNGGADHFSVVMKKKIIPDVRRIIKEVVVNENESNDAATDLDAGEERGKRGIDRSSGDRTGNERELSENDRGTVQTGQSHRDLHFGKGDADSRAVIRAKFSNRDSVGNQLSEGQQEYFKDSAARDNDGNLLVLYHQTDGEFTIFDTRHPGAGTRDSGTPFGIFMKRSAGDIGLAGKKQMALYANITNPLRATNREDLARKLCEISERYASISDQHKKLDAEYREKFEQAKKAWVNYITEWRSANPGASRNALNADPKFNELYNAEDNVVDEWTAAADRLSIQAKEVITEDLRKAGYDGIFLAEDVGSWGRKTDAIIALDPEQVKNITNKKPTQNPDIRYSQRDVGRQEAVTQALEKENAKLREDVAELRELLKLQRQVTNGTKFTKTSVEAAARYLKQNANAKGDTKELSKLLNGLYEYIASTKELTWEDVKERAQEAADWLWEHIDRRGKRSDYAWENNCHGGSLAAYR